MADPTTNFSGRDYTAEVERLLAILGVELPEYTDWNHADPGIVQIRLSARDTDQINQYIDHIFNSGFINTAQFKQYLVDLGMLVGYLPTLASPASTRLRLTRKSGVSGAISIPKYSAFSRSDGLTYLTAAAIIIQDGIESAEVDAVQGEAVTLDLEAADFHVIDWSKKPKYALPRGVAARCTELWHGDPALAWLEVDHPWRSSAQDRHFFLELNGDDDSVWLVLGDGVQGQGPPTDQTVHVRYVKCAETSGNCGHSMITAVPDGFGDLITCTNIEPATGGAAAETTASLRRMIPAVTRTQRRAVTCGPDGDYRALMEYQPGVLHCQAVDRNYGDEWPHMHVVLFVVPDGGGPMSSYLKNYLWTELGKWGHLGNWPERYLLKDAIILPVNIAARIGVLAGYDPEVVRSAVIVALQTVLAPENRTIGGRLTFTELHRAASAVAGVSWIEFDAPREDTIPGVGEIPGPGTIAIAVM